MSLRTYGWNREEFDWQVNPPPAGFGIAVGTSGPPGAADSTLMRTILTCRFAADAIMGSTPAINEFDFLRMTVRFNATWADQNLTPGYIADPSTGDPDQVGITSMKPIITKHWTNANELLVNWTQEEFSPNDYGRRALPRGIGAAAGVTVGLWVTGIGVNLFRHSVPYPITWTGAAYLETLWLD